MANHDGDQNRHASENRELAKLIGQVAAAGATEAIARPAGAKKWRRRSYVAAGLMAAATAAVAFFY